LWEAKEAKEAEKQRSREAKKYREVPKLSTPPLGELA
jgi:hypothetical protein